MWRYLAPIIVACSTAYAAEEQIAITGPSKAQVGEIVRLKLDGLPTVDLGKTMTEQLTWVGSVKMIVSAPAGVTEKQYSIDQNLGVKLSPFTWSFAIDFKAMSAGDYVIVVDWNNAPFGLAVHRITIGGSTVSPVENPTDPSSPSQTSKVTRVTYVYEKDSNSVPGPVASALQRINAERSGIVASEFEDDTTDGSSEVPEQYKVALDAAKKAGLPALVVQAESVVVRVIANPKTEEQVLEVVK